jgi:hypothetical protein
LIKVKLENGAVMLGVLGEIEKYVSDLKAKSPAPPPQQREIGIIVVGQHS